MNNLAFILLIIFCSCSADRGKIDKIEIMSTYNFDAIIYSTIDQNGMAKSIFYSDSTNTSFGYESKVRKELIDSITNLTKDANEEDFKYVRHHSPGMMYCGPHFRIRIKFGNGEELYFGYVDIGLKDRNKKFNIFNNLYNSIANDTSNRRPLNTSEKFETENACKLLLTYKRQKDSIAAKEYREKMKGDTIAK